ncbi:MAG: ribosome-associated translation inhibitor RaiA [Clostridia bacterium]
MKIEIINKRNYTVNDKLREVIERKTSRLEKYFSEDIPVKVFLKSEGDKCKMEMQLSLGKIFLTAEVVADNMYDAIDRVLPKIEKQIIKHKGRLEDKVKLNPIKEEIPELVKHETIVKVKEFELSPMSIEEAMYQMDLSGHEFYVFLDEDNAVKVLYRRFENGYGVIVPKI